MTETCLDTIAKLFGPYTLRKPSGIAYFHNFPIIFNAVTTEMIVDGTSVDMYDFVDQTVTTILQNGGGNRRTVIAQCIAGIFKHPAMDDVPASLPKPERPEPPAQSQPNNKAAEQKERPKPPDDKDVAAPKDLRRSFLESVLPWDVEGYCSVHWHRPDTPFRGRLCRTVEEILAAAKSLSKLQTNIYFCLSRHDGHRTQETATALRAIWFDVDVDETGEDPKKYSSLEEAITSVLQFCAALGIPNPSWMVASGGGLHVYWVNVKTLSVREWKPYAEGLKTAARKWGLKADLSVTSDAARVLRMPDTNNVKHDPPRPVHILPPHSPGTAYDFATIFTFVDIGFGNVGVNVPPGPIFTAAEQPAPAPKKTSDSGGHQVASKFANLPIEDLGEGIEGLPPLPFEPTIKAECGWLRHVHDTGGADQSEPLWHDALRASGFLAGGETLRHEFSNKHKDYNFADTEVKYGLVRKAKEAKDLGYPKCRTIRDHGSAHCKTCPHLAAGKSPLHLALYAWQKQGTTDTPNEQPKGTPGFNAQSNDNERNETPPPDPLEELIPADTLREIQNPRSKKLWNVLMVLKDREFTINSSIALIEKHPTGMYTKYRGRLQNEVEKIWAKLSEGEETKEVPAAVPVGPPLPIDGTIKIFERWLLLKNHTPVYAVLGAIAANYLEGDPVWLGVIGPPSSAKTEILNATSMLPHVVQAATLTVAGLLSGTPQRQRATGAKGGLLQQIGEFGIITLKDFGSILSMHTETRAEVLAALREIYDGAWTRHIGSDGGKTLSWKGKVGLVFAATEVIDSHYAVIGAMGDRFLLSRLAPTSGQPQFHRALGHLGGTTKQMRKELAEAVAKLFAGRRPQPQPISNEEANCIGEVISLAVRLRGAVERDRRTREIDMIYGAEGTARIGLALERLLAGLDTLGVERKKAMEVVLSVALDSVPPLRRRAYDCVCKYSKKHDPAETTDVAIELGLPTNTARRILEELVAHGLVIRRSQGQGKADLWDRADWEAEDKKAEEKLNPRSPKKSEEPEPDCSGAVYALQGMKQPDTVPCVYCRQTSNVYQFADGSLPQDKRRLFAMHPECAEAFFNGQPQPPPG